MAQRARLEEEVPRAPVGATQLCAWAGSAGGWGAGRACRWEPPEAGLRVLPEPRPAPACRPRAGGRGPLCVTAAACAHVRAFPARAALGTTRGLSWPFPEESRARSGLSGARPRAVWVLGGARAPGF